MSYKFMYAPETKSLKAIQVILIDPEKEEIKEISIEPSVKSYHKIIGCQYLQSNHPEPLWSTNHFLYLDEEGDTKEDQYYFMFGSPFVLAGKAIVLRCTPDGTDINVAVGVQLVKSYVTFLGKKQTK